MKFRPNLAAPVLPQGGQNIRLPEVPIAAYEGPTSPLPPPVTAPSVGYGEDSEVWSQTFQAPFPENLQFGLGGAGAVYTTKRAWRACDVYVSIPTDASEGDPLGFRCLSVFVQAVAQAGQPALIASGRYMQCAPVPGGDELLPAQWVVAARAVTQRFQVTCGLFTFASQASIGDPPPITITVVASNQAVTPPSHIGVIRTGTGRIQNDPTLWTAAGQAIDLNVPGISAGPPIEAALGVPLPEIVQIQCVNGAGGTPDAPAARYLMYFETDAVPLVDGTPPQMVWPLGNQDGDGIAIEVGWRAQLSAVRFRASSTFDTLTAEDDCTMQCLVR